MLPVTSALHLGSVTVYVSAKGAGFASCMVRLALQLLASDTVTEYVPAVKPVLSGELGPDGDHVYVNDADEPVPPVEVICIEPLFPLVHDTGETVSLSTSGSGSCIFTLSLF